MFSAHPGKADEFSSPNFIGQLRKDDRGTFKCEATGSYYHFEN